MYYKVIQNPIDMTAIQQRIAVKSVFFFVVLAAFGSGLTRRVLMQSNHYKSLEEYRADWVLMFNNAMEFNVEGSPVYEDAVTLKVKVFPAPLFAVFSREETVRALWADCFRSLVIIHVRRAPMLEHACEHPVGAMACMDFGPGFLQTLCSCSNRLIALVAHALYICRTCSSMRFIEQPQVSPLLHCAVSMRLPLCSCPTCVLGLGAKTYPWPHIVVFRTAHSSVTRPRLHRCGVDHAEAYAAGSGLACSAPRAAGRLKKGVWLRDVSMLVLK